MDKTVAELFAGVGGFRCALNDVKLGSDGKAIESGEWDFVFANQWEPSTKKQDAYECYEARFGGEEATNEDIFQVDKASMPDFSLLVGGFPCLTGDTLVLTDKGYKTIVDVIPNEDYVLSHDGSYHLVTDFFEQGTKEVFNLRCQGVHGIEATGNHKFLARTKKRIWDNASRTGKRVFSEPDWIAVEDMADNPKQWYIGVPVNQDSKEYAWDGIHVCVGNDGCWKTIKEIDMSDSDTWYIVGRFLADGWVLKQTKKGDNRVPYKGFIISGSKKKIETLQEHLPSGLEGTLSKEGKNAYKLIISRSEWAQFLSAFGHGADGKHIPEGVLDMPVRLLSALLEGYFSGDGSKTSDGRQRFSTVSQKLAYGLAAIINKVHHVPVNITKSVPPDTYDIEGRTVNQRPIYTVSYNLNPREGFFEDGILWAPVRAIESVGKKPVYDIEVQDAHSFVSNGMISHNCQDYSVASTLKNSKGIEGKKGVLWWAINDILNTKHPAFVFLENVDRLLLSPSKQRGRDFGIILRCFHDAGYDVQWRVINAGEYGYQQKRRRAYIVAYRNDTNYATKMAGFTPREIICSEGIFSKGFPVKPDFLKENTADVGKDAYSMIGQLSEEFRADFFNAGVMIDGSVYTAKTESDCDETFALRNLLEADGVDEHYCLDRDKCEKFKYLKGSKRIPRKKPNGEDYIYSEGAMPCPDNPDVPARTILTSESGTSRTTHVVSDPKTGKWRLLTPVECERINGFPDGWTDTGMTEKRRYFMMGNALVVDVVAVIGQAIGEVIEQES